MKAKWARMALEFYRALLIFGIFLTPPRGMPCSSHSSTLPWSDGRGNTCRLSILPCLWSHVYHCVTLNKGFHGFLMHEEVLDVWWFCATFKFLFRQYAAYLDGFPCWDVGTSHQVGGNSQSYCPSVRMSKHSQESTHPHQISSSVLKTTMFSSSLEGRNAVMVVLVVFLCLEGWMALVPATLLVA